MTLVHRISFHYKYAALNPIGAGDMIRVPVMPTYTKPYGDIATLIRPSDWVPNLIG